MVEAIVDGIIKDLRDRRGLRQEWEGIDEEIRSEIRARWIGIAEAAIKDACMGQPLQVMPPEERTGESMDRFDAACAAMSALLTNPAPGQGDDDVVRVSVRIADALLAELAKKTS